MYFFNQNIPSALLDQTQNEEDISVLIGENGSGKSTLLNELAQRYMDSQYFKVIAIANTIHDKFRNREGRLNSLKVSEGKSIVKKTLVRCLAIAAQDEMKRFNSMGLTLRYVGFNSDVGFKIRGLKFGFEEIIDNVEEIRSALTPLEFDQLRFSLFDYKKQNQYSDQEVRLSFGNYSYNENKDAYMVNLFKYEGLLRKYKILTGFDLFLYKNNKRIPVLNASSGELTLITSLLYITSVINRESIILIDEPENSLHPKWQKDYVKQINELFYLYQPKIIIATHSPLIINGAEQLTRPVKVYKGVNGEFTEKINDTENVEEIYQDFFDVTTPQNRFLSELVVRKMNELAEHKITQDVFEDSINDLKETSYDDKQKNVLEGIIAMGKKIVDAQ